MFRSKITVSGSFFPSADLSRTLRENEEVKRLSERIETVSLEYSVAEEMKILADRFTNLT
jgi:hypothetical protein